MYFDDSVWVPRSSEAWCQTTLEFRAICELQRVPAKGKTGGRNPFWAMPYLPRGRNIFLPSFLSYSLRSSLPLFLSSFLPSFSHKGSHCLLSHVVTGGGVSFHFSKGTMWTAKSFAVIWTSKSPLLLRPLWGLLLSLGTKLILINISDQGIWKLG